MPSEDGFMAAVKDAVADALTRLPEDCSREALAEKAAEVAHRMLAKRFGKTFKELAHKVAELEKIARKEKDERKDKANEARIIKEYHTILLKKYRLLVTPEELKHHLNGYDKNLKFDLSDDYSPAKKKNHDQDDMLDDLKRKIDTSPHRNKEKVKDLDPHLKKQIEDSHKRLQEKVAIKEVNSKKEKDTPDYRREKDSQYHTLDLDDSKDLIPVKKSSTGKPGREYGFSADLSQIEKLHSPQRKTKRDNPYNLFILGVMNPVSSKI